jgi:DNA replicative helicase MCM subunit Mcm2 (Cdc46/Mcm family)
MATARLLCLSHLQAVQTTHDVITATVDLPSSALRQALLLLVGADNRKCTIAQAGSEIRVARRLDVPFRFEKAIQSANRLRSDLEKVQAHRASVEDVVPIEDVKQFAQRLGFDGFCDEFFREVKGNRLMKKALTLSLFSTPEEPVHTLVIGEPASAKTLARDVIRRNTSGVVSIGANTTRAGLVCNLGTGQLGALAFADGKIVLIDEFDKISDDNIEFTYELLSNGQCSVHSGRIHREIVSRFVAIAFGNPATSTFGPRPIEDIGMDPTLMSRFALIIRAESIGGEDRERLFKEMFIGLKGSQEDLTLFEHWLRYSRRHVPELSVSDEKLDSYVKFCSRLVEDHIASPLRRDLRMGMYIRRIPQSLASLNFSALDDAIIDQAFAILRESVAQWE